MIVRKAYQELVNSLNVKQIIAVTGLRRVGKTTAVKYLLSQINTNNKVYLDLERMEYRNIFNGENYADIVKALEFEGVDFGSKAVIALDEIQLVPNITSVIKYIYDTYDVKFLVTGSSSFYMKGAFSESLAGRKRLFELWPLSFSEFLQFKDIVINIPKLDFKPTNPHLISKLHLQYDEYINYGGFPEVVLSGSHDNKIALLKDILDSYINLDIKFLADLKKVDELYSLMKLLSSRVGSKVDFSKIAGIAGINRHKVKEYLLFLENTFFIKLIKPFVTNPDREIALQNKVYFTDGGLLNILGNISTGGLFENSVYNQLKLLGEVRYYARRSGQEIDFILDGNTAIEVKTTPSERDLKILVNRAKGIGLDSCALVGKNLPGSKFRSFTWGGAIC